MKHAMAFSRMAFTTTQPEAAVAVPLCPRNGNMDALVKHASRNEAYSFDNVCNAVSAALKKAKAAR